ncbi:MAG: YchJ family protein [Pseudomonadales bacterium]
MTDTVPMPGAADSCPCTSGERFGRCCAPVLADAVAATTALALMRSRYTAFVLGDEVHLRSSWDPQTCPVDIHPLEQRHWLGLAIKDCVAGTAEDETGIVEFVARYKIAGKAQRLQERSRFRKVQGCWCYVDGEVARDAKAASRSSVRSSRRKERR